MFTKRELKVIFAAMQWNLDIEAINCDNDEFDAVLAKVHEAADIEGEDEHDKANQTNREK